MKDLSPTCSTEEAVKSGLTIYGSSDLESRKASLTSDAMRLAEMGYAQEMDRKFSVLSLLATAFSLTNSWFGLSAAMITGINSGGAVIIVYGVVGIALISTCTAISLSELASALPSAGGQYFWASELAPRRYANFASYLTGWFSWAGSIFTSASTALSVGFALVGCYQLSHPDFVPNAYHVFAAYILVTWFAFLFNCYGRVLPYTATATLYISLVSFFVILVTVPSVTPAYQSPKFVFATFINNTGWHSNGIAAIMGLINTSWCFSCLDCATHLSEEVPRPERNIPIAIMGTVAIGFVTAFCFAISMFFSLFGDFATLADSPTGVPILALFNSALTGRPSQVAGAIMLESLIIATGLGCVIASHTWQSRLCWAFARDGGLPFSRYLQQVNKSADVPLRAHFVSCVIVSAVGCIYLGSYTGFNSMVTACITLLYVSYAIPVASLLFAKGRKNLRHGPFWLGPVGLVANCVLLAWTAFALIMFSLPYTMPVTADNMNYVSAVYAVVVLIVLVDWFARGKRGYRGQSKRKEECEAFAREDQCSKIPSGDSSGSSGSF